MRRRPGPHCNWTFRKRGCSKADGWLFVRPESTIAAARVSRNLPDQLDDISAVYQQADGHVLLGTPTLTVQFDPELTEADARGV